MTKRGRPSAQDLHIVSATREARLAPPGTLSDAERYLWLELINDQPASAFTATHKPLLEMYVRHIVNARIIADQVAAFDPAWLADDEGLKRYDALLRMAERESRAASSLATRLRITRQAMEHRETAATKFANRSTGAKPWECSG